VRGSFQLCTFVSSCDYNKYTMRFLKKRGELKMRKSKGDETMDIDLENGDEGEDSEDEEDMMLMG